MRRTGVYKAHYRAFDSICTGYDSRLRHLLYRRVWEGKAVNVWNVARECQLHNSIVPSPHHRAGVVLRRHEFAESYCYDRRSW